MSAITVIDNDSQDIHVHAAGCRDIAKSVRQLHNFDTPEVTDFPNEWDAARFFFEDIATDDHEHGTDEWADTVRLEWSICAKAFPCVK